MTKFYQFAEDISNKVHNLGSDTLKIMLTNSAPVVTNTVKADITEIAAGNGYSAGGTQTVQTSCVQTLGVLKLVSGDVVFTASGGTIGPFRYIVLYNSTPVAGPLIAFADYGSSITLNDGESFTVDFSATNGVLTVT